MKHPAPGIWSRAFRSLAGAAGGWLLCLNAAAGDAPPAAEGAANLSTNPPIRQVAPGIFELGQVRLDKTRRTVSFPAVLNMNAGLIEYWVVTSYGKTHESLLRTDVPPQQIHLAMLLLGARGAATNASPDDPAKPLSGDAILIELVWKVKGKEKRMRAEEVIRNRATRAAVSKGPWTYNGSRLIDGRFIAQEIGSIVSMILDPDALVNNPRPGREDDEIWEVKPEGLPPLDAPVEVRFQMLNQPAPRRRPAPRRGRKRAGAPGG